MMTNNSATMRRALRLTAELLRPGPEERDLVLAGEIGTEITSASVHELLAPVGPVRLWLASGGGCHAAATAIFHQIRERPATSVHILRAGSAAALIAMAADWRTISPDGCLLVHRVACVAAGTAADLQRQAGSMAEIDHHMLSTIAERIGKPVSELEAQLDAAGGEWWIDAPTALAWGFVHAIESEGPPAALPAEDPARVSLLRAEQMLQERLCRVDDETLRAASLANRRAAAEVSATYAACVAEHDAAVSAAIERDGLEAVSAKADEALRRIRETTSQGLRHVRRQLRAHDLGGIPSRLPALPYWTCRACGGRNHHDPGEASRLAACFSCNNED